ERAMKHKQIISLGIGALTLAGMALPASAADLGVRPAPIVPLPVAYNWTSCYIGANGGGKWADFSNDGALLVGTVPVFPFGVVDDNSSSGGMGGGQVGCQWQSGAFVFGIEGDFDGTSLRRTFVANGFVFPFIPGDTLDFKNDWQASVRGRLGYAWDRWM